MQSFRGRLKARLDATLRAYGRPGWPRRTLIAGLVVAMACVSLALALRSARADLGTAAAILGISIVGFSLIAWLSFDAVWVWRLLDYPWVCATFVAVLVALTNISENARREELFRARAEMRTAFSTLIYIVKSAVEANCQQHPSGATMYQPAPEPYKGACEQIIHFVPQMEYQLAQDGFTSSKSDIAAWGQSLCMPNTPLQGRWEAMCTAGQSFDRAAKRAKEAILENSKPNNPLLTHLLSTDLRYWYYLLAFFVGLRLSKLTAESFQGLSMRRAGR